MQMRRVECANPAFGFARLEEGMVELMAAHERAKSLPTKAALEARRRIPRRSDEG